uniref:Gag-pol polyprotein n=1 Tax=Oryza sativa subsp. japonica TaxID=39947 RepID=Q8H8I0_ORYSJ|nr:putative gag-pol polyprotein [Oryza sativa Japonica Group]
MTGDRAMFTTFEVGGKEKEKVTFGDNSKGNVIGLVAKTSMGWLWHRRLAHVGMNQLSKLSKRDLVVSLKELKFEKGACHAGEQVTCSHPTKNIMSTSRPLELLHMDLFSPTTYKSIGGNSHCLVIVDDYSRYTWVFFLHDKSIVAEFFKKFAKRAQNEFSCTLVKIRSDNGSEFKNTNIEDYCDDLGIKHELSTTYSPQQNGVVERKKRCASNSKAYQFYNKNRGIVEETADVQFGETNGTQEGHENLDDVAFASCFDIKLFQMDVKSAFLNGEIAELVFVEQPPVFENLKKPNHVYEMSKALYGLKQAPRTWYERLRDFLLSKDFKIGKVDTTLFTKIISDDFFVCQIYVDEVFCKEFGDMISREFDMSLIGELSFFLGLQIKQLKDGTFVSQTKYIKDLLKRFGLEDAKPIKTPMATNGHLALDEEGKLVDLKLYRSMIGSLLYLTTSRPDIMFSVCMCARFQAAPKECHLVAVKSILRYLKHSSTIGLWYPKSAKFMLVGYSDSGYAGCKVDRKSTSGSCQMFGRSLVSWSSKKQNSVALSTAEEKYVSQIFRVICVKVKGSWFCSVMASRTRRGRREPTPEPVSENDESSGEEYAQSEEEFVEEVEGAEEEASRDDSGSGGGEDEESDDEGLLDPTIYFSLNLRNAQQYTILHHHNQFRRPNDCANPQFHTRYQKAVYEQVYANKAFADHKWISWRHISETPEFVDLQGMFKAVGIDRIVTLKQPYDEDLIRHFYATVWVSSDCDAMKWMSGTIQCSINRREFKELLHIHFNNGDDLHDEHTHNPFPIDHYAQFYEEGGRHTYEKVAGLRIIPSGQPHSESHPSPKEIAISKGTIGQEIYYAPYIMRLIQSKLGEVGDNLREHKEYKLRRQLSTPRAPQMHQHIFDQGASSSAAPPHPHGFVDPNAFFNPQYAYFGMQPNDYFNPVLRAINTLSESIQRLSTRHEAMHEDVRGIRFEVERISSQVSSLDRCMTTMENSHAYVYSRRRDPSSTSHYPIPRPPSPPQE